MKKDERTVQDVLRETRSRLEGILITDTEDIIKRFSKYDPSKSIIRVFPQARVLKYKDLYTLYREHRPILPLIIALQGPQLFTVHIVDAGSEYVKRYPGEYFFFMGVHPQNYHLYVKLGFDEEPVRARMNGEYYDRVYFFPLARYRAVWRPSIVHRGVGPRQLPFYDIVPSVSTAGTRTILVLCAYHRYVKKQTTSYIKTFFPDENVNIVNVGEDGTHHFLLGQHSSWTWPQDIPAQYDMIVLEYCPILIYTPVNLRFLLSKLTENGLVLFLFVYNLVLTRIEFESFIEMFEKDPTLTFYNYIMSQETPTPECKNLPEDKCETTPDCKWIRNSKTPPFCGKKTKHFVRV